MKPVLQAILLADYIYIDQKTQKKVIAGTFDTLTLKKSTFPAQLGRIVFLYLSIRDLEGKREFSIRRVDLRDNEALEEFQFEINHDDPLQNVEVILEVPPMLIPHPGAYAFELLYDDELLGSARLTISEKSNGD